MDLAAGARRSFTPQPRRAGEGRPHRRARKSRAGGPPRSAGRDRAREGGTRPSRRRRPRRSNPPPPLRVEPQRPRQGEGAEIAQAGRQEDPDDGVAERRPGVVEA